MMNQLKEKKYFYPAAFAAAVVILWIVLHQLGVRVTYTSPNWDAISMWAIAAVLGLGIYYAIQIPKKITDRQDRVALFERKLDCYTAIQHTLEYARILSDTTNSSQIQIVLELVLTQNSEHPDGCTPLIRTLWHLHQLETQALSGQFLFHDFDASDLQSAFSEMKVLARAIYSAERASDELTKDEEFRLSRIYQMCEQFGEQFLPAMEEELDLRN